MKSIGILKPERRARCGPLRKQRKRGKRGIPTGISGLARNCRTERRKKAGPRAEPVEVRERAAEQERKWTGARVRAQAWREQRKAGVVRRPETRIAEG